MQMKCVSIFFLAKTTTITEKSSRFLLSYRARKKMSGGEWKKFTAFSKYFYSFPLSLAPLNSIALLNE
jgi:hypothetical protein